MIHGLRNSLTVAPMPTASTAQIQGNTESFEPFSSNLFTRRVLSGEFVVINRHLVTDLIKQNLWNQDMRDSLISSNGSVQNIPNISERLKEIYKTAWEVKQRGILEMAADRGIYIDQSQSLNIHLADPSYSKVTSLHFASWKLGLKTGM